MANMDAYIELVKADLVDKARAWLKDNPKPEDFKGTRWDWAHTEMPVRSGLGKTVLSLAAIGLAAFMARKKTDAS